MGDQEELESFIRKVNDVSNVLRDLSSRDPVISRHALQKADLMVQGRQITGDEEEISDGCHVTNENRSVINPAPDVSPEMAQQEMFKRQVEVDARRRYEDRKQSERRVERIKPLAVDAFREHRYKDALQHYNRALKEVRDSALLWTSRAQTHLKLNNPEAALADLKWALRINPTSLRALFHQGKAHLQLHQLKEAQESFQSVLDHHPDQENSVAEYMALVQELTRESEKSDC